MLSGFFQSALLRVRGPERSCSTVSLESCKMATEERELEALGPEKGSRNACPGCWGRLFRLHAIDPSCIHIRVDRMQAPCVFSEQAEGASPQSPPSPPSQSAWHVKFWEPSEAGLSHAEATVMFRT